MGNSDLIREDIEAGSHLIYYRSLPPGGQDRNSTALPLLSPSTMQSEKYIKLVVIMIFVLKYKHENVCGFFIRSKII